MADFADRDTLREQLAAALIMAIIRQGYSHATAAKETREVIADPAVIAAVDAYTAARVEAATAELTAQRDEAVRLQALEKKCSDRWATKFTEQRNRAEAAEAAMAAVLALHRPETVMALSGDCAWIDPTCDCEDECPLTPMEVCRQCDGIREVANDEASCVRWPCPTAIAAGVKP